jgi:hypothetical protein
MRRSFFPAALLAALAIVPSTALAHPEHMCGVSFVGIEVFCPAPIGGLLGDNSAAMTPFGDVDSGQLVKLATLRKGGDFATDSAHNSDLAFWDDYAIQGNYQGFQIIDISDDKPEVVAHKTCPGSQNDVSVWKHLIITSTDSQRNTSDCENNTGAAGVAGLVNLGTDAWEGLRIFDWSDPANPVLVGAVKTKCGSHTHTLLPDDANGRVLVYVSSYGPGANANCLPPHDLISVVEIPLDAPQDARVLSEPVLFPASDIVDGNVPQAGTSGCHDITAYPAIGLAAGACMGEGILLDIADPENPRKIATMRDPNFSFWHSATFTDDGTKVIFTDELGGGTAARCTDAYGPDQGADAIYDISDRENPRFLSYFKIPRYQTNEENCVSHNGSLMPVPGKDMMVQAWYQGGISVIDFSDPTAPKEIAFYDYGPIDETKLQAGGYWSAYWYNGRIYGNEMYRGLDVLDYRGPEINAKLPYLNAQTQEPLPAG